MSAHAVRSSSAIFLFSAAVRVWGIEDRLTDVGVLLGRLSIDTTRRYNNLVFGLDVSRFASQLQ
jgi:nicotinamide mononucleotide adenylyltransferase